MSNENYNALFNSTLNNKLPRTEVLIEDIFPYEEQPFDLYSEEKLEQLSKDISENGLYNPILVRPYKGGYQIISGHNRFNAIKRLDWVTVPVTVETLTDEDAMIRLVNSNLYQRQLIKESEKVKAYTMKVNANKRQGKKGNNALDIVAKQENLSLRTLSRYTACISLIDEFLQLLDQKKISLAIGEQVAKLSEGKQQVLRDYLINHSLKVNLHQAILLREVEEFTEENLDSVFFAEKQQEKQKKSFENKLPENFEPLDYFLSEEKYREFMQLLQS